MHENDTIAAISTPMGEGGIGIVRLSGSSALDIIACIFIPQNKESIRNSPSHKIHYGFIVDPDSGERIDEVLVSVMKAPKTYTREDVIEINCHGGFVPLRKTLELALRRGCRIAEPGEFTKRAFLNGRIDLTQAEAVIDIIKAKTAFSEKIALEQLRGAVKERISTIREDLLQVLTHIEAYIDFPDEEIEPSSINEITDALSSAINKLKSLSKTYDEGRFFKDGLRVAIVGRPNVGKSSLLNALLESDRAIVTETPGTTRDVIVEYLNIDGLPVRIMDTAGIREAHDMAEKEGVKRSLSAIESADLVLVVMDSSEPSLHDEDMDVIQKVKLKTSLFVLNKSDIRHSEFYISEPGLKTISISAKSGIGMDELKKTIFDMFAGGATAGLSENGILLTNLRHKNAVDGSAEGLTAAKDALDTKQPLEIVSMELRAGIECLRELTGEITNDEVLHRIFDGFCIGK